jgi:hypothetical protein
MTLARQRKTLRGAIRVSDSTMFYLV